MNFSDLVTLVEKHGIKGVILSAFLFGIYTLIKSDWFGTLMGKVSDWFIDKFMSNKVKNVESANN